MPWRHRVTAASLAKRGRIWTLWTAAVAGQGTAFGIGLLLVEPWSFPLAAICFWWAWGVPRLQAWRGARSVVPIGSPESEADQRALGLLGDLLGPEQSRLASETGLAVQPGEFGVWLIGEAGAIMVRPGGRRADCWCVRVAEAGDLPGGDRVAHLLLALREDEGGFATVANLGFSGATWRVRRGLPARSRAALDAARELAREARGATAQAGVRDNPEVPPAI